MTAYKGGRVNRPSEWGNVCETGRRASPSVPIPSLKDSSTFRHFYLLRVDNEPIDPARIPPERDARSRLQSSLSGRQRTGGRPHRQESLHERPQNFCNEEAEALVLRPLDRRGYITLQSNVYGDSAWRIVGWRNAEVVNR